MNEREQYINKKIELIQDVLRGIHLKLAEVDELFQIIDVLQDELTIWDNDVYGEWIKTSLSALPPQQAKAIKQARGNFFAAKRREEKQQAVAAQKERERLAEVKRLRIELT